MSLLIRTLNRLFKHREIVNCDRDVYLHRWYIFKSKRVTLFLHKFVRSDEDRALHDHPWNFLVIPLWRGYIEHQEGTKICLECMGEGTLYTAYGLGSTDEELCPKCGGKGRVPCDTSRRVWPIIGTRYRKGSYRHRVELLPNGLMGVKPSWSLFFHFRKDRDWGFWIPDGLVKRFHQWAAFWKEKCE